MPHVPHHTGANLSEMYWFHSEVILVVIVFKYHSGPIRTIQSRYSMYMIINTNGCNLNIDYVGTSVDLVSISKYNINKVTTLILA